MKKAKGAEFAPRDKPKKRPGKHKKSLNQNQRNYKTDIKNIKAKGVEERRVMKKLTITSKNISQKQWSNLILELNLLKKQWKPYADIELEAPGIKKIIAWGTS